MQRSFRPFFVSFCLAFGLLMHAQTSGAQVAGVLSDTTGRSTNTGKPSRPNILFIIMDDVGIDQMKVFGYGGATPPLTPNIDAIAKAGVRFRNVWAMPECSPSRAIFFEGRYPLRTNVFNAILSNDLANSQVSPFEVTTPQVLREKQYTSGLFGKFHLATVTNNEFTTGVVHALGWDYFDGFLDGAPHPIDTTIGNQYPLPLPMGIILRRPRYIPADLFQTHPAIRPTAQTRERASSPIAVVPISRERHPCRFPDLSVFSRVASS